MVSRKKILLLTPYSGHTVAKGVINSANLDNHSLFELNFNECPIFNNPNNLLKKLFFTKTPQSRLSTHIDSKIADEYKQEISQIVKSEKIDLIIPSKEKYVLFMSENEHLFQEKIFLPKFNLINLFQDKLSTYNFLKFNDPSFPVADTTLITKNNLEDLFSKPQFVKPAIGSGGKNSKLINSLKDFLETYPNLEEKLISCEPLIHPEYNHTIILKDSEIIVSGTYQDLDNNLGASSRQQIVNIEEINDITKRYVELINKFYPGETNGVYNIDFLKNSRNRLVLTEVNVGRLPGGHTIFNTIGKNLTKIYIEAGTQK